MDESNLGHNGRNGHPFFPDNFQFFRLQQTQDNRYSSALNETCLPHTDMTSFDTGLLPHVDTTSKQFTMSELGAQDAVSSTYGNNNTINKWQAAGPGSMFETVSNASTMANLAFDFDHLGAQQPPSEPWYPPSEPRYAKSEAGSTRRRQSHKARRRHYSHQTTAAAAAASGTAGPGTVNDMHSTGVPSEQGENDLAAYSIELDDGYFECNICKEKKKPKCDMLKHINAHIRPYKCSHSSCRQSTKGFGTKNDLERHRRIHTDAKHLSRVYICSHGKCGPKSKPWPRWDNLKTHLRDVHHIKDPVKDDYHKENPAAQNQMLAGMVHTDRFGTSTTTPTPADAIPIVDELSTGDMRFEPGAALPFLGSQPRSYQVLDQINHVFKGNGGNPQRHNMGNGQLLQQLRSTNATTATVGFSNANACFSPQFEPEFYPSISPGYSTNLTGLPESATASFSPHLGSHTPMQHMQQDMPFLASLPRDGPRSQGHAPPFAPHQTTQSVHSFTSVNEAAFSNAGHISSLTSLAAASLPPTVENHTTSKMADAVENTFGDYSQDIVMNDAESEADGHIGLDATGCIISDTDLAEDGAGPGSDSNSTSVKSAENAGNAATEAAGLDSHNSLEDFLISGISGTIDFRNDNASHIDQGQSAAFAPPHSPTAVSPSEIILSNSADSGTNNQVSEVEAPENATAIHVEHPNPTPASGLAATLEYLRNCNEDDISKVLEVIPETAAFRNLGVEIRPIGQPPAPTQSASPTPTDPPKDGSSKRHQCLVSDCRASFDSSSGLKKHEIRHKRPFGCTYGCTSNNKPQTFGSKNDWKRHEESFHMSENKPYMRWQCDVETAGKTACRKVFQTSESFQEHLLDKHEMREKSKKEVQERLAKCCLITVDEAKYWCGFCKKYLACMADSSGLTTSAVTASSGPAADTAYYSRLLASRFNHIDNHFSGRGCTAVTIEDWVTSVEHEKATSAIRGAARASRHKREPVHIRETRDSLPSPKYLRNKPRSVTDYHWECCRCGQTCSRLDTQCSDCSVRSCDECRYEPIMSIER